MVIYFVWSVLICTIEIKLRIQIILKQGCRYHLLSYIIFLSYLVYIDENGDAAGNYTILSIKGVSDNSSTVFGLYPIGTFSAPDGNQIPVGVRKISLP